MYSKWEVTIIIADFYSGFCPIRRDIIREEPLNRNNIEYWQMKNNW